ncbi:phosphotransferase [Nocardioides sp. zg-DK7169]|uniref:phosphotransferase family protein n=1 Tax=Nocardioides sp. zg-DK7169 TaxID=2736600 RepID=UPI001C12D8A1
MSAAPVVTTPDELTAPWLAAALGVRIEAVAAEPVGTGQMGTCVRLRLAGPDVGTRVPATLLAKLPTPDPGARAMVAGAYRCELRFYDEIAPTVAVRVPRVHHAAWTGDGADFVLLLEDLAPRVQGDQLAGCSPAQARDAVLNLAGLHGPRWCDPTLTAIDGLDRTGAEDAALLGELFGPATEIFLAGLGDLVDPADAATLAACVPLCERWARGRAERFGLVHGDYRLDNLMFAADGDAGCVALDWQTLSLALPARDLAYFLGTGLDVGERRAHERDLVDAWHAALLGHGVTGYSREEAFEDYRYAMLQGPLVAVFGCAYGTRTERGDRMFATMLARSCAAIRDLGTLSLAAGDC